MSRTTYQILSGGDFISWHLSLDAAIKRADQVNGDDVRIYEMPEDGEMPVDSYPCVWMSEKVI